MPAGLAQQSVTFSPSTHQQRADLIADREWLLRNRHKAVVAFALKAVTAIGQGCCNQSS